MILSLKELNILKESELDILDHFDKVCNEIGVDYSLSYGTLLGAVRHKGFIPWDDDIDVVMLREDYNRFIKIGSNYLEDNYFIQTYESDPYYPRNHAKILNLNTTLIENSFNNLNIKNGVYIDIFPIDKESNSVIFRKIDILYRSCIYLLKKSKYMQYNKKKGKKIIFFILKMIATPFSLKKLNELETKNRTKYNDKNCNYTYSDSFLQPYKLKDFNLIEYNIYKNIGSITFEKKEYKSIKSYDYFLQKNYGKDYMMLPPLEKRNTTHEIFKLEV